MRLCMTSLRILLVQHFLDDPPHLTSYILHSSHTHATTAQALMNMWTKLLDLYSYETASFDRPEFHTPRQCRAHLPRPQLGG